MMDWRKKTDKQISESVAECDKGQGDGGDFTRKE